MFRLAFSVVFLFAGLSSSYAQWKIEESHTAADLRGIANVGKGIVWASGTQGTILRTTDEGATWQPCTTPPDAEKLDFRGVQAFDENTAIVMSSGKGDLSRLYKTSDGCRTWKLVFTNPDKDGFWDAISGIPDDRPYRGVILGDPVGNVFQHLDFNEAGEGHKTFFNLVEPGGHLGGVTTMPSALPGESSFAASNSALIELTQAHGFAFATGGDISKPRVISSICHVRGDVVECNTQASEVPMTSGPSAGIFSLAYRTITEDCPTQEEVD
jgi:photosystem II stability/assembly factor-like uncharacterized protein